MKIMYLIIIPLIGLIFFNSCDVNDSDHINFDPGYTINEIYKIGADGTGQIMLGRGTNPKILSGKNKIIFQNDDFANLNTMSFDGSEVKNIVNCQNIWNYSVSRDGEKIVMSIYENDAVTLFTVNYDGSNFKRITNIPTNLLTPKNFDSEPDFSFDKQKIIFRRNWNICIISSTEDQVKIIKENSDSTKLGSPHFINNNENIVYLELFNNSKTNFRWLNLETLKDSIVLTTEGYISSFETTKEGKLLFSGFIFDLPDNRLIHLDQGFYSSFSYDGNEVLISKLKQITIFDTDGTSIKTLIPELNERKDISKAQFTDDNQTIVFQVYYNSKDIM